MKRLLIFAWVVAIAALASCGGDEPTPASPPSALAYSPNSLSTPQGQAAASTAPSISGTAPISFALASAPSGISIQAGTGIISASASAAPGVYPLSVTATNAAGSQTFSNAFTLTVTAAVSEPPSGLSYGGSSLRVRKHETAASGTPSVAGQAPITFALANAASLPAEITINASTGVVQVGKNLAHGTYSLNITATNALGSQTVEAAVQVVSEAVVFEGSNGVKAFVQEKCRSCHTSGPQPIFTNFTTARTNIANIISRTASGNMPQGGPALSAQEVDLFRQWQADGLLEQ
jgi:hypothetical protein